MVIFHIFQQNFNPMACAKNLFMAGQRILKISCCLTMKRAKLTEDQAFQNEHSRRASSTIKGINPHCQTSLQENISINEHWFFGHLVSDENILCSQHPIENTLHSRSHKRKCSVLFLYWQNTRYSQFGWLKKFM